MQPFEVVETNLRAAMRCYSGCSSRGEIRDHSGVTLVSSGVNFSVFNSAMLTSPVSGPKTLERQIEIARVFFEQRGLDWSFWLCLDLLDAVSRRDFSRIFRDRRLRLVAEPPGLIAQSICRPVRRLPVLDILEVCDEATRQDFVDLSASVFHLPLATASAIYGPAGAWESGMRGFVGYFCDEPVTILTTVETDACVGVYSVGTSPYHQRRGYAETLLRYSLQQSVDKQTILQSTDAGLRLYLRLGYRPVTKFAVYVSENRWR